MRAWNREKDGKGGKDGTKEGKDGSKEEGKGEAKAGKSILRRRIRIGGFDRRKLMYKGTIELEEFETPDGSVRGTFCVMNREKVRVCVHSRALYASPCRFVGSVARRT